MTLTTIQNLQQNHRRIMDVLRNINNLTAAGITYNIMDPNKEPFITICVKNELSEKDTKTIYDNSMTIQCIETEANRVQIGMNIQLSYPFTNPFTYSQDYESKYLYIKDGKSCDVVFLKYAETRVSDALPSDYPGNKDQIYNVNFVVVNLKNGNQEKIWTIDPSFQEEVLDAIQKLGPKLNVRREGHVAEQNTRYYFEQIPLEHARPDEVV